MTQKICNIKSCFNKSMATNAIALFLVVLSYCIEGPYQPIVASIGFFALSGAITNWLAIHMLFEKVPFLVGSGVIPNRFEEFKLAIKNLIMRQFFNKANLQRLMDHTKPKSVSLDKLVQNLDYDSLYKVLVDAIMNSQFAGMLSMLGGEEALKPIKEPLIEKLSLWLKDLTHEKNIQSLVDKLDDEELLDPLMIQIEELINKRLDELTPTMVKEIVQEMIHHHLGWLVVWGGVFGGLIGLVKELI